MTLLQELTMRFAPPIRAQARRVELEEPPFRLAFNGDLSHDELNMLEQGTYDYGPQVWEVE